MWAEQLVSDAFNHCAKAIKALHIHIIVMDAVAKMHSHDHVVTCVQ